MVRIRLGPLPALRILIGLIVLVLGAGLLAAKDLPSTFGVLALVGALAILGFRNYLEVDHDRRILTRRIGVLYGFALSRFGFDAVRRIVLLSERRRTRSRKGETHTRTVYVLRVADADGGKRCDLQEMWPARPLAERVSRELRVPLENRLMGGRSVRAPDDLDLPLAERWRRAGEHKEPPMLPAGSRLIIEHGEEFSEFSAPVEPFPRAITALVTIAVLAALYAGYRWANAPLPFVLIFGGATIFFGGGLLSNDRELVLMGDRDYLVLDKPDDPAEAQLQRQFVERQLAQRQTNSVIPS